MSMLSMAVAGFVQVGDQRLVGSAIAIEHMQRDNDGRIGEVCAGRVKIGDQTDIVGGLQGDGVV